MNRRLARIIVVLTLYHFDITQNDIITESLTTVLALIDDENIKATDFSNDLLSGVIQKIEVLDQIIANCLINWTIDRLSFVDRAIIRLATYEMLHSSLAHSIIINEALEITKEYSNLNDNEQIRFTNKLLDKISEVIKNVQPEK